MLPFKKIFQENWASLIAQLVKNLPANAGNPGLIPGSGRSPGEGIWLPTSVFLGFPCGSAGKESVCGSETWIRSLGWEDSPGEGKGYPLQYSGLENSMDCIVHGVPKSQTRLSNFHFHFQRNYFLIYLLSLPPTAFRRAYPTPLPMNSVSQCISLFILAS